MFVEIFPRPRVCCLIFLFTLLAGAFPSPGVAASAEGLAGRSKAPPSRAQGIIIDLDNKSGYITKPDVSVDGDLDNKSGYITKPDVSVDGGSNTNTSTSTTNTGGTYNVTGDITTNTGGTLTDTDVTTLPYNISNSAVSTTFSDGITIVTDGSIVIDGSIVTEGSIATRNDTRSPVEIKINLLTALDQAEADLLSIVVVLEDPTKSDLDPQAVNRALQAVGDNILQHSNAATATVAGNLHQISEPNIGSFDFRVNLGSGDISKARMSGADLGNAWGGGSFDLSGGTGKLSGNNFSVGGLAGNVAGNGGMFYNGAAVGSLSGTATDSFQNLNDNSISNGQFTITEPGGAGIGSGTITGGRVN